ncbi:metallophosphoesterase [Campylobacter sputorum]|uniref:metallophosphoesterase n=1 Tax=Campylobacter sputorum TaxID=206 RepID=UPI000B76BFF2|nr:metallophosphoesterase [Campylobacter sputorum]ASM37061.1 C-terminal metallophosphatase domain protein [Campylobacter sputorum bv. faecalis CCUG 20703]
MKITIFPIVASLVFIFINLYVYKRFFGKIHVFSSKKYYVFVLIICILEALFFFNLRVNFLNQTMQNFTALLIGISFIAFSYVLIYDIFYILFKFFKFKQSIRKDIKKFFDIVFIIAMFVGVFVGTYNAIFRLNVKNIDIILPNLKQDLKLIQISDIHIGGFLDDNFLKNIVNKVNELNPDIVVITGDLIDFDPKLAKEKLASINDIKSKFGTYFVVGNHEYYVGIKESLENLSRLNMHILQNESIEVGGVNLVGIYDYLGYKIGEYEPNFSKAIKDINESLPVILLAHQPRIIVQLNKNELSRLDLILCGHTHGGQIFPFHFLVKMVNSYLYGLYEKDNAKIYVTSGTGFWGPPIRLLSSSEIVNFNLKGKK